MRRLVVGGILPGDAEPVNRIMHQRVKAVAGEMCRCIDTERAAVFRSPYHFFPPVSEQVGLKNRVSFRAVVGQHASRLKYRLQTAVFSIPFFNLWPADRSVPVMIKQFSDQITVPPDGEIG